MGFSWGNPELLVGEDIVFATAPPLSSGPATSVCMVVVGEERGTEDQGQVPHQLGTLESRQTLLWVRR